MVGMAGDLSVAALYDDKGAYGVAGQMGINRMCGHCCAAPSPMVADRESCRSSCCCTQPGAGRLVLAGIDAEFGATVPRRRRVGGDDGVAGQWQLCWDEGRITRVRVGGALPRLPTGVPAFIQAMYPPSVAASLPG